MNTLRLVPLGILATAVVSGVVLLGPRSSTADDFHRPIERDWGQFEGYLLEDGDAFCYGEGYWHLLLNTDNGYFRLEFLGLTEDEDCFGLRDSFDGCPAWIEDLVFERWELCADEAETWVHVTRPSRRRAHHRVGVVFLSCDGYTMPCELPDEEPPLVEDITATSINSLVVTFSEAMDEASVENASNYLIAPVISVSSAVQDETDASKVYLTTGDQSSGSLYRLMISNVTDLAGNHLVGEPLVGPPTYGFFLGYIP
jgi:hypothetical protein